MSKKSLWAHCFALLLSLAGVMGGASRAAIAEPEATAMIKGRVRAEDGGEIRQVGIKAYSFSGPKDFTTTVDASGYYTLTVDVYSVGSFRLSAIRYMPDLSGKPYFLFDYDLPYTVTLAGSEIRSGIDMTMSVGGGLVGEIRDRYTQLTDLNPFDLLLIRSGDPPILVSVFANNGRLNVKDTVIPPGIYSVANPDRSIFASAVGIVIAPRQVTSITLPVDIQSYHVESVLTVLGMPNVLGIIPPGSSRLLISRNSGLTWQISQFPIGPKWTDGGFANFIRKGQAVLTRRAHDDSSLRTLFFTTDTEFFLPALRSGDGGQTWAEVIAVPPPCDGIPSSGYLQRWRFTSVRASPRKAQRFYALGGCVSSFQQDGDPQYSATDNMLYVSDDYGLTWQRRLGPDPYHFFNSRSVPDLAWAPSLTEDNRIFRIDGTTLLDSYDAGLTWITHTTTQPINGNLLFTDGVLTNTIYLNGTSLFVSNDAGLTWSARPLPEVYIQSCANAFAIPGKAQHVFMRCGNYAYRSRDGGLTWQRLDNFYGYGLFVDYANPGRIYAEKYKDLWASDDEGDTWRAVWNVPGAHKQFLPIAAKL